MKKGKKKNKKDNKKLVIFPIFCISLAIILVFVHVFALPKKALSQVIDLGGFKKIVNNIEKKEDININNNEIEIVDRKEQVMDGQERFTIAAEGDICHPDHYNYTPIYQLNTELQSSPGYCFNWPKGYQNTVEEALANDTDGDNELTIRYRSYPGVHYRTCLGYPYYSSAPRNYRVFVPPGTTVMHLDEFWSYGSGDRVILASHLKTPPQGDYSGTPQYGDPFWNTACRSYLDGQGDPNVMETEQLYNTSGCVFEEENIFTTFMAQNLVPVQHSNYPGGGIQEGGWLYMKLINESNVGSDAYCSAIILLTTVEKDVFLDWYNGATFDADGNPLCDGYSGPSGSAGSTAGSTSGSTYTPTGSSDPEFEGMGIVDPYRGNGIDISSYINDENNIMINADYQNLVTIPAPGEPTIVFDKGVKVDGDVYAASLGFTFQDHELRWSPPIRGNYIYYYR
ncbi:hypothetical protein K8R62_03975 [bacterium]|nr:hypothetical protein [bacterium]